MNTQTEITNWSDHVLQWLTTEEDVSDEFRRLVGLEFARRQVDLLQDPGEPVVLTPALIHSVKTAAGAWTRAQVEALGVKWPPRQGWIQRLSGTEITAKQWGLFTAGAVKFKKRRRG